MYTGFYNIRFLLIWESTAGNVILLQKYRISKILKWDSSFRIFLLFWSLDTANFKLDCFQNKSIKLRAFCFLLAFRCTVVRRKDQKFVLLQILQPMKAMLYIIDCSSVLWLVERFDLKGQNIRRCAGEPEKTDGLGFICHNFLSSLYF